MANIIPLRRKPRPLRKTFQPLEPYEVTREDQDNGSILYEIYDMRPDSYRWVCHRDDDCGRDPLAKFDMEQIARGLNFLVQYGMEKFPLKALERLDADDLYDGDDE